MDTYVILRRRAWASDDELQEAAMWSSLVVKEELPEHLRWIRTYVLAEDDGSFGAVCVYQATGEAMLREHAERVGMPADAIIPIADTVVMAPDPVRTLEPEPVPVG